MKEKIILFIDPDDIRRCWGIEKQKEKKFKNEKEKTEDKK